jgi:PAS domain-containing protein
MLRSWKEIARHMGTSVRTVQRWESELRLPVRRIEARRGAVVFAFPSELDSWVRVRSDTQARLVEDSYFRTVFMDSQFPSLVVDDTPRILAANFAACDLTEASGEQLLGQTLASLLSVEDNRWLDGWAGFLQSGACIGQANLQRRDGRRLGIEFVAKRFSPGLHVLSVLSSQKSWQGSQIWCRPVESDFSFHVRPETSPGAKRGSATLR